MSALGLAILASLEECRGHLFMPHRKWYQIARDFDMEAYQVWAFCDKLLGGYYA